MLKDIDRATSNKHGLKWFHDQIQDNIFFCINDEITVLDLKGKITLS